VVERLDVFIICVVVVAGFVFSTSHGKGIGGTGEGGKVEVKINVFGLCVGL
jgi:hypothetical protein